MPLTQSPTSLMKQAALHVFRKPPERLNCAQSVRYAWREVSGDTVLTVADLKPFGAGQAPDGLCGALYAACQLAPNRSEELKAAFAARLGSVHCKEIRAAKKHPCADCVAEAAELLSPVGNDPAASLPASQTKTDSRSSSNWAIATTPRGPAVAPTGVCASPCSSSSSNDHEHPSARRNKGRMPYGKFVLGCPVQEN